jgi:hypothetical protein
MAHNLKQLAVKHAELLAQDPAGNQQRFDDRGLDAFCCTALVRSCAGFRPPATTT